MRLITRGDLDGLACAVLITTYEKISKVVLVHPQDLTNDRIPVTNQDIIANLPRVVEDYNSNGFTAINDQAVTPDGETLIRENGTAAVLVRARFLEREAGPVVTRGQLPRQ